MIRGRQHGASLLKMQKQTAVTTILCTTHQRYHQNCFAENTSRNDGGRYGCETFFAFA